MFPGFTRWSVVEDKTIEAATEATRLDYFIWWQR